MRARDVMAGAVVTTTPETTVKELARLMINHRVSGVPVIDRDARLVGIITEGDLLRRAETGTEHKRTPWEESFVPNSRLAAEYIQSHAKLVADIMTRDVISVEETATLGEIANLFETKRIKRVPVLHNSKIIGIVSRADLLRALASGAAATTDDERDHIIRARLLAELQEQRWANPTESNLVVSGGIVHFWGAVGSEEQRRALRVAAENTPGVRAIEDNTEVAAALPVL